MRYSEIDVIGQLADLKDVDYNNTLAIATLIELLCSRGIFTREEFRSKSQEIELATVRVLNLQPKKNRTLR